MNNTVAIIGAGQMGSGIAQTVAANGIDVLLADVSLEVAEQARAGIDKALGKLVGKGKIEIADAEATLKRITPVADYAPMQDASLIIEELCRALINFGKLSGYKKIYPSLTPAPIEGSQIR